MTIPLGEWIVTQNLVPPKSGLGSHIMWGVMKHLQLTLRKFFHFSSISPKCMTRKCQFKWLLCSTHYTLNYVVWQSQTLYLEGRVWGHVIHRVVALECSSMVVIINREIVFGGRG